LNKENGQKRRSCANECLQPFSFTSYAYDDFDLFMPLFLCRQWDGFARPLEGQTLKWVYPDELSDLNLVPADIEFMEYGLIVALISVGIIGGASLVGAAVSDKQDGIADTISKAGTE